MTVQTPAKTAPGFLDMQAQIGVSKHMGGYDATHELLALCHIEDAREVLNVGCGIGAGSIYIAKQYGCRVTGMDLSAQMIAWARRRARSEGVAGRIDVLPADVLHLPFAADCFDVVFAESVLIFVEDKAQAIGECVRVTKPGGFVGLNEGLWTRQPPPQVAAQIQHAIGPYIPMAEDWQGLWEGSRLQERVMQVRHTVAAEELKSRIEWIGWRWLIGAWGRALRLYIENPSIRESIKAQFDVPPEALEYTGHVLLAGKKPQGAG